MKIGLIGGTEINDVFGYLSQVCKENNAWLTKRYVSAKTNRYAENEFASDFLFNKDEVVADRIMLNPVNKLVNLSDYNIITVNEAQEDKSFHITGDIKPIVLVNSDNIDLIWVHNNINDASQIISYGFNSKSSVTASSVLSDSVMCCIQRDFTALNNEKLKRQEFVIKADTDSCDIYALLAGVTISALVYPERFVQ